VAPEATSIATDTPVTGPLDAPRLDQELTARAFRGGSFTLFSQIFMVLVQTGTMLGLARFLSPSDFGLFAMVAWVMGFLFLFKDLGLSIVTVQRVTLSQAEVSFLFWANVLACSALAFFALFTAPVLAWIYHEKRLLGIMALLSLGIFIHGFGIQHQAMLNRRLRLGVIAGIDMASVLCGSAAGLIYAWKGGGFWALVLTQICFFSVNTVLLCLFSGWRPDRPAWVADAGKLLGSGGSLTIVNVIGYLSRNTDSVLVGFFWGPGALGYYTRASQLLLQPSLQIGALLRTALVPTLSRLNDRPARFRRTACDILANISRFSMPIVTWMVATSDWIIVVMLGERWRESSVIFSCLGVAALLQPLTITATYILVSQSRSRDLMQAVGITSLLVTLVIFLGLRWGAIGAAVGVSLGELMLRLPIFFYVVGRRGPIKAGDLYAACTHGIIPSLLVFLGIWELRHSGLDIRPLTGILCSGLLTLTLGGGAIYFLPGGRLALNQIRNLAIHATPSPST
jgi:O-antigen/teichoic acid export membrane protein